MDENSKGNRDYTKLGGWLLSWYWLSVAGGIISILLVVWWALLLIPIRFTIDLESIFGVYVSKFATCVSAVIGILAAIQLKARDPEFFDTFMRSVYTTFIGSVVSSIIAIKSSYDIGDFWITIIISALGATIGVCLFIMYFSKSVRVYTYFGKWPLYYCDGWVWIRDLPKFIISEPKR